MAVILLAASGVPAQKDGRVAVGFILVILLVAAVEIWRRRHGGGD